MAKVLRQVGKHDLIETRHAYVIRIDEKPVVILGEEVYTKKEAIEEFWDFVRC